MIRLVHLSVSAAPLTPVDAVAVYRALLVFLLIFAAMLIAHYQDERQEKKSEGERRKDASRRIREFQATQSHARRK